VKNATFSDNSVLITRNSEIFLSSLILPFHSSSTMTTYAINFIQCRTFARVLSNESNGDLLFALEFIPCRGILVTIRFETSLIVPEAGS
jgi:hypothetical protein